jgi:hypothetical protein
MFQIEIQIKEKINPTWFNWFEDIQVKTNLRGDTILYGNLHDKSAVYGILSHLSNLGLTLISVTCLEDSAAESSAY